MSAENLNQLEEKLYSDAFLLGDRQRQQAAKQLAQIKSTQSIKILSKALIFSQDLKLKSFISTTLRTIKLQDSELVNAVCEVWAENRDAELGSLIKTKGWIPTNPIGLRLLIALSIGWNGIIEEKKQEVILPLFNFFNDNDPNIADTAQKWAMSISNPELQQEVCRLAIEEKNELALKVATEAGYVPQEKNQAVLFSFMTQQWEKYAELDPDYQLLEEIYYSAEDGLKERIDEQGKNFKRVEWVWAIVGGKEGRKVADVDNDKWEKIIGILAKEKNWQEMWSLTSFTSVFWTKFIIEKIQTTRWRPENPEEAHLYSNWTKLAKNCQKQPPKGKLVRCIQVLEGHTRPIESVLITPDGKWLMTAGDENVRLWDLNKKELLITLKGHVKSVTSLALSEKGDLLASASRDKTLCVWRIPDGNLVQTFSANVVSAWCLAMTGDGSILASGSYQETRIWQFPMGKLFKTIRGHKREVQCIAISPNNSLLATGGGSSDNTIRLYELPSSQHLVTLEGHEDGIWCMAISPDSRILATGSKDNTIKLWSLPDGTERATLEGHTGDIWCMAISPDGKILATGSNDKTIKLWDLQKGKLLTTLEGHEDGVWCLNINKHGDLLVSGSRDNTIRLWKLPDGENVGVLTGHSQPITNVAITPDGQTLVSGSDDKTLRLWSWDLPRLCNVPISLLDQNEQEWIKNALSNSEITVEERYWLIFLDELIHSHSEKLADSNL